jgi:hypothetical protein
MAESEPLSAQLTHGAGLLACALADAGADNALLTLAHEGEVVIVLRKGSQVLRMGRVPAGSSFVRWTKPANSAALTVAAAESVPCPRTAQT